MDRWNEGSWCNDTIRHGRFITIADQSIMAFIAFKPDAYKDYPEHSYSVSDTTNILCTPLFLEV